MATIKKYNGSTWENAVVRKFGTATETIQSGDTIYANGQPITTYTIKGNTVQDGTPTPSNPVEINGVGVRTENLFDYTKQNTANGYVDNAYINIDGNTIAENVYAVSEYIEITGQYLSLSVPISLNSPAVCFYDSEKNYISGAKYNLRSTVTEQIPQNAVYIRFTIVKQYASTTMVNLGDTLQPYEPHGYKIPISSGGVTTNIYLGSTQTVRQIKKYVMTGNETISNYASDFQRYVITIPTIPSIGTRLTPIICTHYIGIYDGRPAEQVPMNAVYTGSATDNSILIKTDQTTDRNTFIAWLQEQYTNGTPVTIWYAVSTPETAAVNEPLMKIGTYADALSNATSIPTTEGANSISVDTTVQPSEFSATWTGWHDASVKEYDGANWN